MVSTQRMLLLTSFAGIGRRAVGRNGHSFASAFLTNAPSSAAVTSSTLSVGAGAPAIKQSWRQPPLSTTARFMSTDAATDEKTEEEKAAIKAAREARK